MLIFDVMTADGKPALSSKPIGVFDSGIGGLTVLRQLMQYLPGESFVYLGDTARVPYGNKSEDTVQRYSLECTDFLLQHDVRLIVVACNTASAIALDVLSSHAQVPVVGVIEPAARDAVDRSKTGVIGVIGTRATIASDAYARCIAAIQKSALVYSRPCPLFVPLVEEGWLDTPATQYIAETYLQPLLAQNVDTLVLGCTHYPLLAPLIQRIAPGVHLVDCGTSAAATAAALLGIRTADSQHRERAQTGTVHIYLTDRTPTFQYIARELLGMNVEEPVITTLRDLR